MDTKTLHLVVRFSDTMFSVGEVTEKHNDVAMKVGYVWFGKFGNPISEQRISMLTSQMTRHVPTYLYLVKGNRKKSTFYQADLLAVARQLPDGEESYLPAYYTEHELNKIIRTWFKISSIRPVDASALSRLKALGSVYSILETLVRSSSGYFLVHEAKELF